MTIYFVIYFTVDFFDAGVMPSASTSKVEEEPKPAAMSDKLPEGFFDDPKQDAKVRSSVSNQQVTDCPLYTVCQDR